MTSSVWNHCINWCNTHRILSQITW